MDRGYLLSTSEVEKSQRRHFDLRAECKLIGHPRDKRVALYCADGIHRFIQGENAWTDREAIMVAYVRDGSTLSQRLHPYLELAKQGPAGDRYHTELLPFADPGLGGEVARSRHGHPFAYTDRPTAPGPIELWHIWLNGVNPSAERNVG